MHKGLSVSHGMGTSIKISSSNSVCSCSAPIEFHSIIYASDEHESMKFSQTLTFALTMWRCVRARISCIHRKIDRNATFSHQIHSLPPNITAQSLDTYANEHLLSIV